jgi:hypothetical protein
MKLSQGLWAVIAVVVAAGLCAYIWITGQGTAPQVDAGVEQTVSDTPQAETAPVMATEEPAPVTTVEEAPAVPEAPEAEKFMRRKQTLNQRLKVLPNFHSSPRY